MKKIYGFLRGYTCFSFSTARAANVLDYLLEKGIGTLSFEASGEDGRLTVLSRDADRLAACAECKKTGKHGLFVLLSALLRRPGLMIGGGLAILLLTLSSLTVWQVEINGNELLSAEEITCALEGAGLSVGDFIPRADLAAVKTRVLQEKPEIGWISLYIRGTTVAVEVRESTRAEIPSNATELCNLIAREDGIIEAVNATAGRAVVRTGMSVQAGELLVSGIYRTATGLRAVRAEGEVYARVNREISVSEPFLVVEKDEKKAERCGLSVEFFGRVIKVFEKTSKSEEKYDIINKRVQWHLPWGIPLPIFTLTTERSAYDEVAYVRDREATSAAAYARLRAEMEIAAEGAVILKEDMQEEWTEEGLRLVCRYTCVANIADLSVYDVEE